VRTLGARSEPAVVRERALVAPAIGAFSLVAVAAGFALDPDRAVLAYLTGWSTVFALAAGALALLMIGRVTGAVWFVALRRPVEAAVEALPLLSALFLPIALSRSRLYRWPRPEGFSSPEFFLARSALYLIVISSLGWALARETDDRRARSLSAVGLPVLGIAFTGGTIDWLLSLDPEFASTVHGVYVLTGGFEAALALATIVLWRWVRTRALPAEISASHFHSLGKLLLTAAIFWAYIAYAQGLVVWIADLPPDAGWYIARTRDGWGTILTTIVASRFVLPFFLLLPRATKRSPSALAAISTLVVLAHALDGWWLVLPPLRPTPSTLLLAVLALSGVSGSGFAFATWSLRGRARIPVEDPRLPASLRYETT
jgi:hypothetical protein